MNDNEQQNAERKKKTMEKFNNFNDIEHMPLRVFNRAITIGNIKSDFGINSVKEYINQFSEYEKKQIAVMLAYIEKFGVKKAQDECTAGVEFNDEG